MFRVPYTQESGLRWLFPGLRDEWKMELNAVIPHIVAFLKITLDTLKLMGMGCCSSFSALETW